jgi:heat shock protein HslJ
MTTDMNNPNNKKWVLLTVVGLLLLMVVLFAACAKPTPTPIPTLAPPATNTPEPAPVVDVNQLYANPWVLVGYGNPDNPTVVESGTAITLQFAPDGQLGGFSGCNNYSGTFQASQDGTMSVSPLAMTMMACAEGMDLESVYLSALQSTRSFTINNEGRLLLSYNDPSQPAQVLIYAIGAKSLTSTTWVLVAYGDPVSSQAVPPDSVITAIFYDDGALSGSSGCNQYAASYTTQDQQLTIGPIGVTQMACPAGMELEQAYLSSLGTAERYEIKGQQLVITYNQGAGVLTYIAANLPLEYTLWTLATLNGQAVSTDTPITAVFTPGEETGTGNISGSSGCNTYNADYTLTGTSITVGPAATTRMACATGMDIEQTYLQALQTSTSYQILADKLVLTNPTGSLTYVANRTQLVGALWKLVALGDVNNPQQPVAGSDFSAQFIRIPGAPSGILNGTTGCNEYTTAFTASLDEMKVNMPVSTNNTSCAPGLSDQEQLYFLALNNATTYHISGNT